jgi:hypothetical protein
MYDVGAVAPIAYHGTRMRGLEKFDIGKVGTGQGAASYGHGLYFAENPKVAGDYQRMLAPSRRERFVVENFAKDGSKINGFEFAAKEEADKYLASSNYKQQARNLGYAESTVRHDPPVPMGGATYSVDIKPPAEKFLNWDKPLSEQSEQVKKNLKPLIDDVVARVNHANPDKRLSAEIAKKIESGNMSVQELYSLAGENGSQAYASRRLNELGIPGIRYLDQGSRGTGKGTYNYVVFSDKDVSILERK